MRRTLPGLPEGPVLGEAGEEISDLVAGVGVAVKDGGNMVMLLSQQPVHLCHRRELRQSSSVDEQSYAGRRSVLFAARPARHRTVVDVMPKKIMAGFVCDDGPQMHRIEQKRVQFDAVGIHAVSRGGSCGLSDNHHANRITVMRARGIIHEALNGVGLGVPNRHTRAPRQQQEP